VLSAACFFSQAAFCFAGTIRDMRDLRFSTHVATDSDLLGYDAAYYRMPTFRGNTEAASSMAGMRKYS
jgi:hypothetical protein